MSWIAPQLSAVETAAAVGARRLSAEERIRQSLTRIDAVQPALNAFTLVLHDEARAAARALDRALAGGAAPGLLCGVPVAIKDFTPTAGHLTTRGSWSVNDHAPTDPVIVRRLKAAGAIVVGKTTTPEFAFSSFTRSPRWGVTRNPHDPSRTPGGSSGGSAAAVASGCVPLAEGTDMGGSVRIPAALTGVVGLKPSLGRIPMDILPGCLDDMSHFGPLALSVADAALFLQATQGPDDSDLMSQTLTAALPAPAVPLRGRRFALSLDLGYYAVDPGVEAVLRDAARRLAEAGAEVVEIALPWTRRVNDLWLALWGVALAAAWGEAPADRMDPDLAALIAEARGLDAVSYKRLEAERSAIWHAFAAATRGFDAFLCPTCALPAPSALGRDADHDRTGPDGRYHGLDMTCPFNLLSPCPAISLPAGRTQGLPVGLQVVGRRQDDAGLLALAAAIETVLPRP